TRAPRKAPHEPSPSGVAARFVHALTFPPLPTHRGIASAHESCLDFAHSDPGTDREERRPPSAFEHLTSYDTRRNSETTISISQRPLSIDPPRTVPESPIVRGQGGLIMKYGLTVS